ncbi:hypothetical protein [Nitrosomonas marina]|uniref:Uncharacterized protein n=1 Tax=Nitrosomonas marina TaxID=917 RepID=A0A1H8DHZ8_9PROT|nr:hypothetical protein [Nitrosomonas marina]SEN06394.1 hypothetical protein SAMN05216325_1075 [Nitrosomonas marina]
MPHIKLTTFLIIVPVLLFSGAVSSDTAPQHHPDHSDETPIDTRLLQAINALEQKAAEETRIIESLNERIARLEQKIAVLNTAVIDQQKPVQTIQIESDLDNQGGSQETAKAEPDRFMVGSATTQIHSETNISFLDVQYWRTLFSRYSTYLIPASAGIMAAIILLLVRHVFSVRRVKKAQSANEKTPATAATAFIHQNPIATNEKNAVLAQKLAALRSAVAQGKQKRQEQK